MIIVIQSSSYPGESAVDTELQRAFVTLHVAKIRMLGGGRFVDGTGYVVLANDADALAALTRLGIGASILHHGSAPKRAA